MLEKTLTNRILKLLKDNGFFAVKIAGGIHQQPGISDILACTPQGLFLAIEVKQKGKHPTALQRRFLDNVRKHSGIGLLIDDFETAKQAIKKIIEYEI